MKKVTKIFVLNLMLIPTCLAEHMYKGTTQLHDDLFDKNMDCGLNLQKIEECVKEDRSAGKGESFCNDVKLFAGNKQKMIEADAAMKKDPKMQGMQMAMIKGLNEIQKKFAHQFIDAGLKPEEIGHIPPIKNFQCKKLQQNIAPAALSPVLD
jgi:hypothetical protein